MNFNLDLKDIKYLKITYKDINDTTHYVKVSVKQINNNEIFSCAKLEYKEKIQVPQDIALSIICENGLYKTNTTLKLIEKDDPYVFFTLKTPEGLNYEQNREYFRVKMEKDVLIKFDNKKILCKSYDISANGIKLILKDQIKIPEEVRLDIDFESETIITLAKLIRSEKENNINFISFNFINMSENNINTISKKCIQQQLQDKRNSIM